MLYLTENEIEFRAAFGIHYIAEFAEKLSNKLQNGQDCKLSKRNLKLLVAMQCMTQHYIPVDISDPDNPEQLDCLTEAQIDHIYEMMAKMLGISWPAKGDTTLLNEYLALVA